VKQLDHAETLAKMPKTKPNCAILACGVSDRNLGLILRSAEAFGVEEVFYLGEAATLNTRKIARISRGSHIPVRFIKTINDIQGCRLVALEITDGSTSLTHCDTLRKTCLVVGHEKHGIPDEILYAVDTVHHIEMPGGNRSTLNVAIAASIGMYEFVRL